MAEPARPEVADLRPAPPQPRRSDPHSPGWRDVRAGMIAQAALMRLNIEELARAVADARDAAADPRKLDAALEAAALHLAVAESWGILARRQNYDESVLARARQEAFEEGVAWCKASSCRLGVIRGGR